MPQPWSELQRWFLSPTLCPGPLLARRRKKNPQDF